MNNDHSLRLISRHIKPEEESLTLQQQPSGQPSLRYEGWPVMDDSTHSMPEEENFILQHQPRGQPILRFEGFLMIDAQDDCIQIAIRADRQFKGEENCYETCELIRATGQNGEDVDLSNLIMEGNVDGKFDLDGGQGSRWVFDLKLKPTSIVTHSEVVQAILDGSYSVTGRVTLRFRHTATEFIPRACPPGVVRSPCAEALVEERQFTYESERNAKITLVWRVIVPPE